MQSQVTSGLVCAALALAGCSSLQNFDTGSFYVQPGKYQFLKCPDLAKQSAAAAAREKDLVGLMERANQDTAGPIVNAMVYSTDLGQVRAELQQLQQTAHEKGCDAPAPEKRQAAPAR
jgi:hypothetical protein